MIGNFEPKKAELNIPVTTGTFADYSAITDVFLCDPSIYFTTTTFVSESTWNEKIAKDKTIYPIHNIIEVNDQSEETSMRESKQNFRFVTKKGKYRFVFSINVDIIHFKLFKKYEGRNLKAYFKDINGNLFGVLNGSNVLPFDLDSIIIEKIPWGSAEKVSNTRIIIDLYNPDQIESAYIVSTSEDDFNITDPIFYASNTDTFTRNNCSEGYEGSSVEYAKEYYSRISQADADAYNNFEAEGQAYANANGTCTLIPPETYSFSEDFSSWTDGVPTGWTYNNAIGGNNEPYPTIENDSNRAKIVNTANPPEGSTEHILLSRNLSMPVGTKTYRISVKIDSFDAHSILMSFSGVSGGHSETYEASGIIVRDASMNVTGTVGVGINIHFDANPQTTIIDYLTIEEL